MPTPHLFGTDGIRAPFGEPPLDRGTVLTLGWHLGHQLGERYTDPTVVLGGDTRASTPELCRWLTAGLTAAGARVRFLGVVPTPAVAYLAHTLGAAAGIAVSASHNPFPDNGIKLITGRGFKWSPREEAELEERIRGATAPDLTVPTLGPPDREAVEGYLEALRRSLPAGRPLDGLTLVLDPGHGAASPFAGPLFGELGAAVTVLNGAPDGTNINRGCGSTHPQPLARAVRERGADLGLAFDGDADRAILVDETGAVRDGDDVLFLWASGLQEEGLLAPPKVVATSMSNLGLVRALADRGIELVRCGVGDREVVETMIREGATLGGEQSGHVVHLGLATTGDGLLTALQMAHRATAARRVERPFSSLFTGFARYPQILLNVRVARKEPFESLPGVAALARDIESQLGGDGRLVLRYSGTEPLARVMIEGPEATRIEDLAQRLARAIESAVGAPGLS